METVTDTIIDALARGDAASMPAIAPDPGALGGDDGDVAIALRRAAECVVFHRPGVRDAVARAVELGAPCDLWTAARAGLLERAKAILEKDPELLDAKDAAGRSALQRAALVYGKCEECEAVVDDLIARGAVVDVFTAATFGMTDIVDRELARDSRVVSARCQGSAPLGWAVRPRRNGGASPAIVRALVDAGADLEDRDTDEQNMTPLHHVAEWGQPVCLELAEILIGAGADTRAEDSNGWRPIDYARDRGRAEMVALLETHPGAEPR